MGLLGLSSFSSKSSPMATYVVLLLGLVLLSMSAVCKGGKTSTFVRKVEKAIDMPLDSDVFQVPHGYNAPQQVYIHIYIYMYVVKIHFFGKIWIEMFSLLLWPQRVCLV